MKITDADKQLILTGKAKLHGEGDWFKDSAYAVFDFGEDRDEFTRYAVVLLIGNMNREVEFDGGGYIKEELISGYI